LLAKNFLDIFKLNDVVVVKPAKLGLLFMEVLPPGSFGDQILRPWGQRDTRAQAAAWAKTIIVGIFSIGLVQAGFGLYALWLRGRNIKLPKPGTRGEEHKIEEVAKEVLPRENDREPPLVPSAQPFQPGGEEVEKDKPKKELRLAPEIEEEYRDLGREEGGRAEKEDRQEPEASHLEERPAEIEPRIPLEEELSFEEELPAAAEDEVERVPPPPPEVINLQEREERQGGKEKKPEEVVERPQLPAEEAFPPVAPESPKPSMLQKAAMTTVQQQPRAGEAFAERKPAQAVPLSRDAGLRAVNTAWFLERTPAEEVRRAASSIAEEVFQASCTSTKLPEADWIVGLRAYTVLIRGKGVVSSDNKEQIFSLLVRHFLTHGRSQNVPREFCELYEFLKKDRQDLDKVFAFFSKEFESARLTKDPNAIDSFNQLMEEAQVSDWRVVDLSLEGVSEPRPWPSSGGTDRQAMLSLLQELAKQTPEAWAKGENLRKLSLALLFILSAHTLDPHEWRQCRLAFLQINRRLDELRTILRNNPPSTEQDKASLRNFLRLYFLLRGSTFGRRLKEDVPGHPILVNGNKSEDFTATDLIRGLNEARAAYASDKRSVGVTALSFNEVRLPSQLLPERGLEGWREIFYESAVGDVGATWEDRQQKASFEMRAIEHDFQQASVPIDFQALVTAIQNGDRSAELYLKQFPDGGLIFLRDYVYPYCVLQKVVSTEAGAPETKFLGGAASPMEICELGGKERGPQVAVLKNVLQLIRPEGEMPGGILARSAIHSSQIDMLRTMVSSIQRGKPVYICNETGTGKTTMAKLAPQLVSLPVPMVLHVAPFPQAEEDWTPLRQWSDLDRIGSGPTAHFWVTASSLAQLMQQGVPEKYRAVLQKSFLLMDEYDHESYRYVGAHGATSVQEELSLRLGCHRICNMSATPNLETYSTAIARYEEKRRQADDAPEAQRKYYQQRIDQLAKRRESLLQSMAHEWRRSVSFEFFGAEDPKGQVGRVFQKLRSEPFAHDRKGSVLVEMPRFVLTPDFVDELHRQMEGLFPANTSAILLRDSEGHVQAHTHEGGAWKVAPLDDFLLHYSSIEEARRPPVVCFYSQDSVGGDFGLLSNERVVRSQHIAYPGPISPSYAIYQHMRRQRVNVGSMSAGEKAPSSKTPITVYLGPEAQSSVYAFTAEELKALPTGERGGAERESLVDELRKKKFIELSQTTADDLYRQEEVSRLKTKILRKKERVVSALLAEDKTSLQRYIDRHFTTPELKSEMLQRLDSCMAELVSRLAVGLDEDVSSARKRILDEVVSKLCGVEPGEDTRMQLQLWQAYESLYKIFPKSRDAVRPEARWPYISTPPNYWGLIEKFMQKSYAQNSQQLCVDVFLPIVQKQSRGKDTTLHPVPSREALERAMLRLRGRPEQYPQLDHPFSPPSGSHIAPTLMIEALIGATSTDSERAHVYLDRLEKLNAEAEKGQKGYVERRAQIIQAREELVHDIQNGFLACFQKTDELTKRPVVYRALNQARWYEQRLQSYQKV
jgi:hypothetical protein